MLLLLRMQMTLYICMHSKTNHFFFFKSNSQGIRILPQAKGVSDIRYSVTILWNLYFRLKR